MFTKKNLKITAVALLGVMTFGFGGIAATSAEAASHNRPPEHHERWDNNHRAHHSSSSSKKYSEGDRNTAALIGAVIGAVIAKNT